MSKSTNKATENTLNGAVIIYGPQGCGKTTNAEALAAHFKKSKVIDDWDPSSAIKLPANAIAFTNVPCAGAIKFAEAMAAAGQNKTRSTTSQEKK